LKEDSKKKHTQGKQDKRELGERQDRQRGPPLIQHQRFKWVSGLKTEGEGCCRGEVSAIHFLWTKGIDRPSAKKKSGRQ